MTTIATIDTIAVICSSIAALTLACYGAGVWAIIWQQITLPVVKTALALYYGRVASNCAIK